MRYDFLIVGSGLYGATMARCLTDAGKSCLVIDKRSHIGGNVYDEEIKGHLVCRFGAHAFHCNDERIWEFVNRFCSFNSYEHRVKASVGGKLYSFPISMHTFQELWGVETPEEAQRILAEARLRYMGIPAGNARDWLLSQIGPELYELFYRGYTTKQWGRDPRDLPAAIVRRIPIRFDWDDRYFTDKFQGMPIGGYTRMVAAMLEGIEVRTGEEFRYEHIISYPQAERLIFTGPLDELFGYKFGRLEYRSLRFATLISEQMHQPVATVNYPGKNESFTRITEWPHFYLPKKAPGTAYTLEWPQQYSEETVGERFYPVSDERNKAIHKQYLALAEASRIIVGGRLGDYCYRNMDSTIGAAFVKAKRLLG